MRRTTTRICLPRQVQLFHGDPETQAVYYTVGSNANGPLVYLSDIANHDARTEGMSYGMMIAVQLNHKAEFGALRWTEIMQAKADRHRSHARQDRHEAVQWSRTLAPECPAHELPLH